MNIVLGIIISTAVAAVSASCLIGTIACMAAAQRKYFFDRERGCKVVVFPAEERSPLLEDPTYATDYETGKLTLIQDKIYSDEDDKYNGKLLENEWRDASVPFFIDPSNISNAPKFQDKGQQTVGMGALILAEGKRFESDSESDDYDGGLNLK